MKRVAVTGAAGFIGHHLVRALEKIGLEVLALDDFSRGMRRSLAEHATEAMSVDVTNLQSLSGMFDEVDSVIHLAAVNGTKNFYEIPKRVFEVGCIGTLNVIQECIKSNVSTLVFASSAEVYGEPIKVPTNECDKFLTSTIYSPRYSYGSSKLVGEFYVNYYARHELERTIIFRPHNVYGENMGNDHVIPQIAQRILRQREAWNPGDSAMPVTIQGSGDEIRSFAYIEDIVRGILILLSKGETGEIYNIGNPEPTKIADLVHLIAETLSININLVPSPSLPDSPQRRIPDISKIQKLGYVPQVDLRSGVQRVVNSLKG
jgi:UDP-glucose 4-epimerase